MTSFYIYNLLGGKRFYDDMEKMIGFRINPWCRWCWMLMTPAFCLVRKRIQGYSLALHCASLLRTSFMSNSVRTLKHGGFCFKAGLPRGAQGKLLSSFKRVW